MVRIAMAAAAMVATTALFGTAGADERRGYEAIVAQDWAGAERALLAEMRIHPRRPELMLNLAAVYARTGRDAEARALYAAVLDRPAVAMDLPSGEVRSSHALAHAGLGAPATMMAAAR